jgi:glycosyltransferase involved in cell wall biosynthesis
LEVSLVTTVKDEERSIDSFLDSVFRQTRRPDEVIVVDGGSGDRTLQRIRAWADREPSLKAIEAPKANIAAGRNIAIAHARGRVIAVTDAGTVLDPRWLERLVRPLLSEDGTGVASGFFDAGGTSALERAISVVITPRLSEVDPENFLPSSRSVAFLRDLWQRVGGYPEWLNHCEDLVFDLSLRDAGAAFAFVPEARVTWRARRTLGGFFRQYFHYARGDGHALLWTHRHALRYSAYAAGAALAVATRRSPWAAVWLGFGIGVHFRQAFQRVAEGTCFVDDRERASSFALIPVIVVLGDVAKMIGYPLGRFERAQAGNPERIPEVLRKRSRRES